MKFFKAPSAAVAALLACQFLVLGFLYHQTYFADWTGGAPLPVVSGDVTTP